MQYVSGCEALAGTKGNTFMAEDPKITKDVVSKIEDSLEERKVADDRRRVAMNLPKALERRTGADRRDEEENK